MLSDLEGAVTDEDTAIGLEPDKEMYYTDRRFDKSELKQYAAAIGDYNIPLKLECIRTKGPGMRGFCQKLGIGLSASNGSIEEL